MEPGAGHGAEASPRFPGAGPGSLSCGRGGAGTTAEKFFVSIRRKTSSRRFLLAERSSFSPEKAPSTGARSAASLATSLRAGLRTVSRRSPRSCAYFSSDDGSPGDERERPLGIARCRLGGRVRRRREARRRVAGALRRVRRAGGRPADDARAGDASGADAPKSRSLSEKEALNLGRRILRCTASNRRQVGRRRTTWRDRPLAPADDPPHRPLAFSREACTPAALRQCAREYLARDGLHTPLAASAPHPVTVNAAQTSWADSCAVGRGARVCAGWGGVAARAALSRDGSVLV